MNDTQYVKVAFDDKKFYNRRAIEPLSSDNLCLDSRYSKVGGNTETLTLLSWSSLTIPLNTDWIQKHLRESLWSREPSRTPTIHTHESVITCLPSSLIYGQSEIFK